MDYILIEVGVGALIAGTALFTYVKRTKSKLKRKILRMSAEGKL